MVAKCNSTAFIEEFSINAIIDGVDYVTRKRLNKAFAVERFMDVLQQVKLMDERRRSARRERRRLRRKQKRAKLAKARMR